MPTNSLEPQESESTACAHNFLFESLASKNYKRISAENPIQVFRNLDELENFLNKNKDLLELDKAGIAGYIGYEGNCELAVYQKINIEYQALDDCKKPKLENITIKDPDNKKYIAMVKKCQEYIKEGDIYQANIAHKFIVENFHGKFSDLYQKIKEFNPAPFAGYMNFTDYEIISSSPESFLKIHKNNKLWSISSSPIKGTAKINELNKLLESSKEKAEHIMIVDLIRNDLGRICRAGSIKVTELMGIHKFENLYHYISNIEGVLLEQSHPISLKKIFDASFPGGSITGTPKIRAMEIIKEIEDCPRELFTGSMGYFRFKDGGEFNILIRSIIHNKINNEISFFAGSGITAYSDPQNELEETYLKAEKLAEAFGVKLW